MRVCDSVAFSQRCLPGKRCCLLWSRCTEPGGGAQADHLSAVKGVGGTGRNPSLILASAGEVPCEILAAEGSPEDGEAFRYEA